MTSTEIYTIRKKNGRLEQKYLRALRDNNYKINKQ